MAIKIAVCSAKGGVAKTTTAVNVADALIYMGYKVLFVDTDPQMNSTSVYAGNYDLSEANSLKDLLNGTPIEECILETDFGDIIIGDADLWDEDHEVYIRARENPTTLRDIIKSVDKDYDFIIFDTPPNVGAWMKNALIAADGVVIPFTPNTFAVDGLGRLLEVVDRFRKKGNKKLKVYGVVLTRYDKRNSQDRNISEFLPELGERLHFHPFKTNIRICQDIEKSIAGRKSLFRNYGSSNGAVDYVRLSTEILKEV